MDVRWIFTTRFWHFGLEPGFFPSSILPLWKWWTVDICNARTSRATAEVVHLAIENSSLHCKAILVFRYSTLVSIIWNLLLLPVTYKSSRGNKLASTPPFWNYWPMFLFNPEKLQLALEAVKYFRLPLFPTANLAQLEFPHALKPVSPPCGALPHHAVCHACSPAHCRGTAARRKFKRSCGRASCSSYQRWRWGWTVRTPRLPGLPLKK